ncbi:MAG TPA: hypothetical protein VMV69_01575 [Pirellulales bacterium]|nr:hypothetical protein [Pirellulales bacterium]
MNAQLRNRVERLERTVAATTAENSNLAESTRWVDAFIAQLEDWPAEWMRCDGVVLTTPDIAAAKAECRELAEKVRKGELPASMAEIIPALPTPVLGHLASLSRKLRLENGET